MIDALQNIDRLREPQLELSQLSLCGVRFGAPAAEFPRERVVEVTLSPIASSLLFDKENDKPKLYLDEGSDPIPLERVVDSVLGQGEGVLHFAEHVSFRIEQGAVAGFSLYGRSLLHFRSIANRDQLLRAFGWPNKLVQTEAHGDLLFIDAYYARSKKWLRWDDRRETLAFIALGGGQDDVRAGNFGSIVRRESVPAS